MHKSYAILAGTALFAFAAPVSAQLDRSLPEGQPLSGAITRQSETMMENVNYLDSYEISGRAGERMSFEMMSEDFDSFIEIGRMVDGGFQQLAADDDGGTELNSRLVFTFPTTGDYILRARPLGADTLGSYTIQANRLPPAPPPPPPSPIRADQSVGGTLDVDSPTYSPDAYGSPDRYYGLYELDGRRGQEVTITLSSDDFDTYLEVGGMTPAGFAVATSNDDAPNPDGGEGYGLNSQVTLTFEQDGPIMIRATSLGGGSTGGYTLTVD